MRSTSVLFFLCFLAVLIAANPIAGPTEDGEHRGTQLKRRDLEDADSITPIHGPFDKRTPVVTGKKTGKTTKKKTTPKGPTGRPKGPQVKPKGPKAKPKKDPKTPKKDPIACPLPKKNGAKGGRGKKTTGKARRDLERRCGSTPSAMWTEYYKNGTKALEAYEAMRAARVNKDSETDIQKVLNEEYFAVPQENQGVDPNLRDYMNRVLHVTGGLDSGFTQYETYSCKPPQNPKTKPSMHLLSQCSGVKVAYRNQFDVTRGVIHAEFNYASQDTHKKLKDIPLRPALSDILFLQYKKLAEAAGKPVRNLKFIARVKIENPQTGALITEAHKRRDAPEDNVIPGWKVWRISDVTGPGNEVVKTLAASDNGKASVFILSDWAGYLAGKSIVAVHTYIMPPAGAKYMIWEFSA